MNSLKDPVVWILGDVESPEFQLVLSEPSANLIFGLPLTGTPNLIVYCSPSRRRDDRLIENVDREFPATPRMVLLGSHGEGETQTGSPLQHWHRRFWYQWPEFYRIYHLRFCRGIPHPVELPSTATLGDTLPVWSLLNDSGDKNGPLDLTLDCRWESEKRWLEELFASRSIRTVGPQMTGRTNESDTPLLLVRDSLDLECQKRIQRWSELERMIILLLGFPRWQEWELAARLGVTRCMGRPFVNTELIATIQWEWKNWRNRLISLS